MIAQKEATSPTGDHSLAAIRLSKLKQSLLLMSCLTLIMPTLRLFLSPKAIAPIILGYAIFITFVSIYWWLHKTERVAQCAWLLVFLIAMGTWGSVFTTNGLHTAPIAVVVALPIFIAFFAGTQYLWHFVAAMIGCLCVAFIGHLQGFYPTTLTGLAAIDPVIRMVVLGLILIFSASIVFFYERAYLMLTLSLRQSEERQTLALDATEDAIYDWYVDAGTCFLSPQFENALGYAPGTLITHTPFAPRLFRPREHERVQQALKAHFFDDKPFDIESQMLKGDGQMGWFQLRGALTQHQPRRMVGSIRNINERKSLETIKQEFISNVSHEVRTPLTSIIGSLRLLNQEATMSPAQQKMLLQIAERNSERLLALVNDMLELQKLQSNITSLTCESIDLRELCEEAIALHAPLTRSQQLTLKLQAPEEVPALWGDVYRIHQVLGNLLSNAIKHSPEHGTIKLHIRHDKEVLTIEVKDQGPGIPEDFQQHLFERFSRWDGELQVEGTGLGLAITKQIVQAHGGQISFQSSAETGTSFFVVLPRLDRRQEYLQRQELRSQAEKLADDENHFNTHDVIEFSRPQEAK